MKQIEELDNIKIYFDNDKYAVMYNGRKILTYLSGKASLINDDLVIVEDNVISIYQDIRQGLLSASIISKQGVVLARPMLYNDVIIVVYKNGIVQLDTNLNVVKSLSCEINGIISQERIVDNCFIFVINMDNEDKEIIYNIENNIIEHQKKLSMI